MNAVVSYWQSKSVNEQAILLAAGVMALVMLGWLAIAAPLIAWREDARAAYVQSAASHDEIRRGIARYQALQTDGPQAGGEQESVRSMVAGAASRSGIVLSRVLPDEAGRLNVWIDNGDTALVMNWLETLSRDHGVVVVRAGLETAGDGQLRAQLLLARGGS